MSALSDLLGAREPMFTHLIRDLEIGAGKPNIDIRFSSEIAGKVRQKMRELGLDPQDTSGKELYAALQDIVTRHDGFLARAIGVKDSENTSEVVAKIKQSVDKLAIPRQCWALKQSVVRKFLRETPPKRVMKLLNYRSVESMLKRESAAEILGAARFIESATWMQRYLKNYRQLQPADFENRNIEVIVLDSSRYRQAARDFVLKKHRNLTYLKEMGVILLLPLPVERLRGATITLLPVVLYYMNELRFYSSYFKFSQVRPDFAYVVIETLLNDADNVVSLAGQGLHWRVVQRHFGAKHKKETPEVFEPYIRHEDFEWKSAEDVLFRLEPALKFWEGTDFLGAVYRSGIVSFNLLDNAISYCNGLKYGEQLTGHLRGSLWAEFWSRYMDEHVHKEQVLEQLDANITQVFNFSMKEEVIV